MKCPLCNGEFKRARKTKLNVTWNVPACKDCGGVPVGEAVVAVANPDRRIKFDGSRVVIFCERHKPVLEKILLECTIDASNCFSCESCKNFQKEDNDWSDGICKLTKRSIKSAHHACLCDRHKLMDGQTS